jgi:hypothetical protein
MLPACLFAQTGLKVNEVGTGTPDWIEIANLGGSTVNVGGYKIRFGGNSGVSFVQGVYVIPAGTMLAPNTTLVITDDPANAQPTVPAGVFRAYAGAAIVWNTTPSVGTNGAVALTDPADVGIDQVKWGNPLQDFSSFGSPFTGSITPSVGAFMYRSSPFDTDSPVDWTGSATSTAGAINPGEALVLDMMFSNVGGGGITINVVTVGPPVPGGEIFNLFSLIDSVPNGSGPLFGIGADALLQATTPLDVTNPFHTLLDGNGNWQLIVPPGTLPVGLHVEAVSVLLQSGAITRIASVEVGDL